MGHLEDSLSSQPFCQQKKDLGVETATAVHIPHHSGEHLLRRVDSKAEMGRYLYSSEHEHEGISVTPHSAPWWTPKTNSGIIAQE